MPANLTPIWLSPCSPEVSPVENVWQSLRQNGSPTASESHDNISDAACAAWNKLTA
jgi:hypothetical protein